MYYSQNGRTFLPIKEGGKIKVCETNSRLPPMWPGFDSGPGPLVEFGVGSRLASSIFLLERYPEMLAFQDAGISYSGFPAS